jgi:hypothetical protein
MFRKVVYVSDKLSSVQRQRHKDVSSWIRPWPTSLERSRERVELTDSLIKEGHKLSDFNVQAADACEGIGRFAQTKIFV